MNRLIAILLCICGVVVCAFLAFLGKQHEADLEKAPPAPPEIACSEVLSYIPNKLLGLRLIDFKPGKHFVSDDYDGDKQWDRVLIPVFPAETKRLGRNYKAVIVVLANTPDKQSLDEKINSVELEAEYWRSSQTLDGSAYNRLAEKYKSLDFSSSVVVYSGYPKTDQSYGNYMFWGGAAGSILSIFALGWQSISLVVYVIRREKDSDTDEIDVVSNRAGLPTRNDKFKPD